MKTFLRASLTPIFMLGLTSPLFAQQPSLVWTTNIGALVFAADSQTNVYAQANTKVIKVSGDGVPLQTNSLSIYPGVAQRDPAGNLYYAGTYPGVPSGSCQSYTTNHSCFLAKYDATGLFLWSVDWGLTAACVQSVQVSDVKLDLNGNIYVGWTYSGRESFADNAAKFDANGANVWSVGLPEGLNAGPGSVRFGPLWSTNGIVAAFNAGIFQASMLNLSDGGASSIAELTAYALATERPVGNFANQFYDVEGALIKRDAATNVIWTQSAPASSWTVGEDFYGGAHLGTDGGQLARYDYDGTLIWTTNLPARCTGMVLDPSGNRFISMADGTIARLSDEAILAPTVISDPQGQTLLAGSNYTFSVRVAGSAPLRYFWLLNGGAISNQTTDSLTLTNVNSSQAGNYSVIVTNFAGSATSAPALLRVKSVALFLGNQLLTNDAYAFASPPTLSIRSAYPNGSAFYTLDGSVPSFSSIHYGGPFSVSQNATVRATGYSADFSQSEEADPATIILLTTHTLLATSSGGGSVSLNPPGGTYVSTNVITVTAVPAPGWTFLYWLGDAASNSPVIQVSMEQDKAVQAVFGTTLSTTVAGNGQVQLYPPGGTYSYGTIVRVTGVPQPGNYFGFWGNAATGNMNPLDFTVNAATQTISSIFSVTPANESSLTVLINGSGVVSRNPSADVYTNTQNVLLTGAPGPGQSFLGWSGDATGAQNPLSLSMSQSRVVIANFTSRPQLRAERLGPGGFRLTLLTPPSNIWQVLGSSNLGSWVLLGTVTNLQGEVQFLDPDATALSSRFYKALLVP